MSYVSQLPSSTRRLYEGNELGWQPYGWGGQVRFVLDFADLTDFITVVAGTVETVFSSTQRVVPLRHPDYSQGLVAVNMNVKYIGYDAANSPPFAKAVATIQFASPQWPMTGASAFQTITRRGGSEVVTIPGQNLFVSGSPIDQDAGVFVSVVDIAVTQFFVPVDLSSTLDGLVNRVNNATLLGHPAGTVLFSEYSSDYQVTTTGTTAYQLSLSLSYRDPPWGMVATPSGLDGPVTYGDGTPVYTPADLSALFPT